MAYTAHWKGKMRMLTLDVVTKDLAVTLGSSLSKSLSSLAAARHDGYVVL